MNKMTHLSWGHNLLHRQRFMLSFGILISVIIEIKITLKYIQTKGLQPIIYIKAHITVNLSRSHSIRLNLI